MTNLPTELQVLAGGVLLLFFHIAAQSFSMTMEKGVAYNASARDGATAVKGVMAQRLERASRNFQETFPAFVALALALVAAGKTGGSGGLGAWIWLGARILYVPLYATGVPYIRTLVWMVSIVGLAMMLARLLG